MLTLKLTRCSDMNGAHADDAGSHLACNVSYSPSIFVDTCSIISFLSIELIVVK